VGVCHRSTRAQTAARRPRGVRREHWGRTGEGRACVATGSLSPHYLSQVSLQPSPDFSHSKSTDASPMLIVVFCSNHVSEICSFFPDAKRSVCERFTTQNSRLVPNAVRPPDQQVWSRAAATSVFNGSALNQTSPMRKAPAHLEVIIFGTRGCFFIRAGAIIYP